MSPAGCKCISELRSPRIRCHSELGRGKIPDPALPLLASGAGYSSPSYRLQAAGGLPAEPGRSCCAQLEDSAGREARSALAAREAETAGCWLRPRLPELAHQRSGAWCAFSSLAEWISGDTCYLPWFLAAWVMRPELRACQEGSNNFVIDLITEKIHKAVSIKDKPEYKLKILSF